MTVRRRRSRAEHPEKADVRSWKAPIALAVFTVLYALLMLAAPRSGVTTFRISTQADALQLPEFVRAGRAHDLDRRSSCWCC